MTTTSAPIGLVRAANVSGLGAVQRELTEMHKAMLRAGGDVSRGVRLSVMTLVVACIDDAESERAAEVVAQIATQHPARALLVTAHPDDPPGLEADLRLECSAVGGPDNHVCGEIVRLRVGGEPARHLISVVAPLLLPDVPVRLWIAGTPPLDQGFSDAVLALVERIVVDSDAYEDAATTLRMLASATRRQEARLPITDLAWLRMEPWREMIARAFDPAGMRPQLLGVDSVSVSASGRSSALLAAGWLVSRLGIDGTRVAIDVAADASPGLRAVRIHSSRPSEATVDVSAAEDGLHVRVALDGETVDERSVPLDTPSLADLVGAALEEGSGDPVHAQALRAAAELAG